MKKSRMLYVVVAVLFTYASIFSSAIYGLENDSNVTPVEIASTIYNLKQGQTLALGEGYYQISGQAYLQENDITIQGAGKDKTFIYVNSADSSWGITVTGSNCTLQDLTVERSTNPNNAAVIKVMGGNNTLISNVKTIGGFYGIDINPSLNTVIDHCEITNTSKGSIGVGGDSGKQTTVTIQNTTTSKAGWMADVVINDKQSYGNVAVVIGKGNLFTNGSFYTENYVKSDFVIDSEVASQYTNIKNGNYKIYTQIVGVEILSPKDTLEVGKTMTMEGVVSSLNPVQTITWESLNPSIATINQKGEVTGLASGDVVIRATAGQFKSEYTIKVFKVEVSVPDIDVSNPTDTVNVGITDPESKNIINETSNTIIDAIVSSGAVDEAVISTATLDNIKNALSNGLEITTKVETNPLEENTVDIEDKEQIIESTKNLVVEDRGPAKVAQYLDINITLEAKNESLGEIYQLDKPIAFTVAVPEDLKKEDRNFYVVRIHNGVSTILQTVENADGTISFETNLFSTYALIYDDKVESQLPEVPVIPEIPGEILPEIPEQTQPEVPDISDAIDPVVAPTNQKTSQMIETSDSHVTNPYVAMCMLSLVIYCIAVKKRN